MDSRTIKLLQSIDAYMERPPPGVPEQLIEQITSTKDMLSAPLISGDSPGEQVARQVTEEHMPENISNEYLSEPSDPVSLSN